MGIAEQWMHAVHFLCRSFTRLETLCVLGSCSWQLMASCS